MNEKHLIACIRVKCQGETEEYLITDRMEDCEYEGRTIISDETAFWKSALSSYKDNKKCFQINEFFYEILDFEMYDKDILEDLSYQVDLTIKDKRIPVYVYKHSNQCQRSNHELTEVTALVYSLRRNENVEINISYCEDCNRYYIHSASLGEYRSMYGLLCNEFIIEESSGASIENHEYNGYHEMSELASYGYSVAKKGPSDFQREKLLVFLIENNLMSKSRIKSWIEFLLEDRGHNFPDAAERWKSDLQFINEYHKSRQRKIFAHLIRS